MVPSASSSDNPSLPPAGQQWADLRTYTKAKQVVAREIRSLAHFFHTHGSEQAADPCREWMVKLAEDRFTLAVVGQFKRGKSLLMNAIIGRERLLQGANGGSGWFPVQLPASLPPRFRPLPRRIAPVPNRSLT